MSWIEKLPRKIIGVGMRKGNIIGLETFKGKVATHWIRKVLFSSLRVGKGKIYFEKFGVSEAPGLILLSFLLCTVYSSVM